MTGFHLAQVNISRLLAPLDSALLADFVAALEPVNAVADTGGIHAPHTLPTAGRGRGHPGRPELHSLTNRSAGPAAAGG